MVQESNFETDGGGTQTTVLVADDSESIRTRLAALVRAPGLRNQPERWTERARLIQNRVAEIAR